MQEWDWTHPFRYDLISVVFCFPQPKPASRASFHVRMAAASRRTGAVTVMMTAGISQMSLRHVVSLPHMEALKFLPLYFHILSLLSQFFWSLSPPSLHILQLEAFYQSIVQYFILLYTLSMSLLANCIETWSKTTLYFFIACVCFLKGFDKTRSCLLFKNRWIECIIRFPNDLRRNTSCVREWLCIVVSQKGRTRSDVLFWVQFNLMAWGF